MRMQSTHRAVVLFAVVLVLAVRGSAQDLATEEQRLLYALGAAVGQNLPQLNLTADELAIVQQGLADLALGHGAKLDMKEYGPRIQNFAKDRMGRAAAARKAVGTEFLKQETAEPSTTRTESGLIIAELTPGAGESPGPTDKVTVHYRGTE